MFGNVVQTLRATPDQEMAILSPEAIREKRALARKLMEQGSDYSPVASPWQGAARVSSGLLGALQDYWTTQDEQRGQKAGKDIEARLLSGIGGGSPQLANSAPQASSPLQTENSSVPPVQPMTRFQQATQKTSYDPMFRAQEEENELPAGYLARTAQIESRTNPNAKNPNSSAGGMFQFINSTAEDYGLTNRYDPQQATRAAAELAYDNKQHLMKVLGREPTAGELYLAHQQGAGGAAKMLANPNARAIDVVGAEAVRLNGGNANMTAGDFSRKWTDKFSDIQPAIATEGQTPPVIQAQARQSAPAAPQTAENAPASTAPVSSDPSRLSLSQLMAMQNSPGFAYAPKGTQAIVQALIQKQVTQETRDPRDSMIKDLTIAEKRANMARDAEMSPLNRRSKLLEISKGERDMTGYRPATAEEKARLGYGPDVPIQIAPDGKAVADNAAVERATQDQKELEQINTERRKAGEAPLRLDEWKLQKGKASAPAVNIDQKQESEFGKETGKALAKRFDAMVGEGDEASQNLETVAELRRLGQNIKTGGGATIKAGLGKVGIKLDGVSDIEAFNALVDRLTPQQRIAGSGATSDFDAKMFKGSLPTLMNTPEGNTLIFDTMDAIVKNKMARGDIAMRVQIGDLKPSDALKEIRKLQDEARAVSDRVRDFAKPKDASAMQPPSQQPMTSPSQEGWQDLGNGIRIRPKVN